VRIAPPGRFGVVPIALYAIGCGPPTTRFLFPPPLGSYQTLVVAFETDEHLGTVYARAIEGGAVSSIIETVDPASVIEAALFTETLEMLGVTEGTLEPVANGSALTPDKTFRTTAGSGGWTESAPGPLLSGLRYTPTTTTSSICPGFDGQLINLAPSTSDVYGALPAGSERWLLTTLATPLILDLQTQKATAAQLSGPIATTTVTVGYADSDGTLYLGAVDGAIWRVTSLDPLEGEMVSPSTAEGSVSSIDGGTSTTAGGHEIFTLAMDGSLDRFDGHVRTTLLKLPGAVGLARSGPGEVFAISDSMEGVVLHLKVGERPVFERAESAGGAIHVTYVPGFGPLLGTVRGEILSRQEGVFRTLGTSPLVANVNAISGFEDGFVASGTGAFLAQYTHGRFCPVFHGWAALEVNVLVSTDAGILMLGQRGTQPDGSGVLLRVKR
jgi:hypothetical protein